ncbi:MAG: phosphoserine phosphatase SerB, partial [Candidatus Eiseniibacteriota bacterium]
LKSRPHHRTLFMSHVLTLIADPAKAGLDAALAEAARAAIVAAGAKGGKPDWLKPGVACDIPVETADGAAAEAAARQALGRAPVDVALQPAAGRRKRLLVADMESTIIRNEMLDELAEFAGIRDRIADITRRAMNGELDFRAALSERVGLLKGLDAAILEQAAKRIAIMPGATALVGTMRANGAYTALVSGGFRVFTDRVARALGFDENAANVLEIADGKLAGTVAEPILGRDAKLATLKRVAAAHGFGPADALAVGDGANDLDMLKAAGLGVAFHAKPVVAQAARVRVDHGDLTALLYLQGYRAAEFVG